MPRLRVEHVTFSFNGGESLFEDVSFELKAGWTGLVGPNGAGKSTLLELLCSERAPGRGQVTAEPEPILARQDGGAAPDGCSPLPTDLLSPGALKRLTLEEAFAQVPGILLLDEPTNHLDQQARGWLLAKARRFRGIGVLVSHDRALLDALTTQTLRISGKQVTLHPGPYSEARAQWELQRWEQMRVRQKRLARASALATQLDDAHRNQEGSQRQRNAGRRMRSRHDSDARSVGANYRAEQAEKTHGRRAGVVYRQLERARADVPAFEADPSLGGSIFFGYAAPPMRILVRLDAPRLAVLSDVRVSIQRGDRVWVTGINGAGKTTLLRALVAACQLPRDRLLYLPQELSRAQGVDLLEEARRLPPDVRGRTFSIVAALGVDPARLLRSANPSPGEARKLALSLGLGRHAWMLVLDEPTNHLDLPSIEKLEHALGEYPGTLVLVSHDEMLGRACTTTRWVVKDGTVR